MASIHEFKNAKSVNMENLQNINPEKIKANAVCCKPVLATSMMQVTTSCTMLIMYIIQQFYAILQQLPKLWVVIT